MHSVEWLEALLDSQQAVLARLRDLNVEERTCLMEGRLDRLDAITHTQAELLAQQAALSGKTSAALERLAADLHLPAATPLHVLAAHLGTPAAHRLTATSHTLSALAADVQREGRINWHLAQQAMRFVDFTLKLIGRAKEGPQPYAPLAQTVSGGGSQLLLDSCA